MPTVAQVLSMANPARPPRFFTGQYRAGGDVVLDGAGTTVHPRTRIGPEPIEWEKVLLVSTNIGLIMLGSLEKSP